MVDELVKLQPNQAQVTRLPVSFGGLNVLQLGDILAKSGYFSDIKSAAQAQVKVLRGLELGIGAIQAIENIHMYQGKTSLQASLIGALIKRSGKYDYRIVPEKFTNKQCEIEFFENGKLVGVSTYTTDDAQQAGLMGKDIWRKFTKNMLFSRAMSNGAKWHCAEIFGGAIYTSDELEDEVRNVPIDAGEVTATYEEPLPPNPELITAEALTAIGKLANQLIATGDYTMDLLLTRVRELLGTNDITELADLTMEEARKVFTALSSVLKSIAKENEVHPAQGPMPPAEVKAVAKAAVSRLDGEQQLEDSTNLKKIIAFADELTKHKDDTGEFLYTPGDLLVNAGAIVGKDIKTYEELDSHERKTVVAALASELRAIAKAPAAATPGTGGKKPKK